MCASNKISTKSREHQSEGTVSPVVVRQSTSFDVDADEKALRTSSSEGSGLTPGNQSALCFVAVATTLSSMARTKASCSSTQEAEPGRGAVL